MDGANQPEVVAANVEHHDRITTGHAHLIRRAKAAPQIGEMLELRLPHNAPPDFQACCGLRMSRGKIGQSAFPNNPHAYNLYSLVGVCQTMNNRFKYGPTPALCDALVVVQFEIN
jgi:hypothetical protein